MTGQKRDLIALTELTSDDIHQILLTAKKLKQQRLSFENPQTLKNKSGVMIFEKPSLRTRITFETAIYELGGHPINLPADTIGMGKRESVADIAKNLERWVHLIIARTFRHETVLKLAEHCSIPVINALTDLHHPCQALAFAQTLFEHIDHHQPVHVVFIGDSNNVCNSIMTLCVKLGFDFTIVCPREYEPTPVVLKQCQEIAKKTGSTLQVTNNMTDAVKNATAIYTDVWTSMGQEQETEKRRADFAAYQVNETLLRHAPADVIVSHCLPAHRGEEITSQVLDSRNSVAFDEAENRLHVQKAVIVHLFS